jgi:hypothetical protein
LNGDKEEKKMPNYEVNVYFMVNGYDGENTYGYGAYETLLEARKELRKEKRSHCKEEWYPAHELDFYISKVIHYEEVIE